MHCNVCNKYRKLKKNKYYILKKIKSYNMKKHLKKKNQLKNKKLLVKNYRRVSKNIYIHA